MQLTFGGMPVDKSFFIADHSTEELGGYMHELHKSSIESKKF